MSENSSESSPTCSSSAPNTWKKDKICLVCGDKALGYNFNAISCESCKAFFRRNAHKTIRGRCQGHCEVTVESRSFCKRCRQQKCFTVGMKKEMIMNAEQKKVRKLKIITNRMRRSGQSDEDLALEEYEAQLQELKTESESPVEQSTISPQTANSSNTLPTQEVDSKPLGQQTPSFLQLSEEAISKLDPKCQELMAELENAHEMALKIPVKTSIKATPSSATQFFNLAEGSVHRMVKLAKGLSAFTSLSKDDQIALLKGAVTEIMMIRSTMYFDSKSKIWDTNAVKPSPSSSASSTSTDQQTSSPPSAAKQFLDGASLYKFGEDTKKMFHEYLKFVRSLLQVSRGDLAIIKMLTALALFSSDRPDVEKAEVVQSIQESYANLLKSYVKIRFPDNPFLFPRIIMKLTDMRDITEIHSKMLSKMNVLEVEPLLIEIFDLGQDV